MTLTVGYDTRTDRTDIISLNPIQDAGGGDPDFLLLNIDHVILDSHYYCDINFPLTTSITYCSLYFSFQKYRITKLYSLYIVYIQSCSLKIDQLGIS